MELPYCLPIHIFPTTWSGGSSGRLDKDADFVVENFEPRSLWILNRFQQSVFRKSLFLIFFRWLPLSIGQMPCHNYRILNPYLYSSADWSGLKIVSDRSGEGGCWKMRRHSISHTDPPRAQGTVSWVWISRCRWRFSTALPYTLYCINDLSLEGLMRIQSVRHDLST